MKPILLIVAAALCFGCASSVEVSRMTADHYAATKPEVVELLKVAPSRPYKQIADVSAMQFPNGQSERMYAEIRAKAASVGADAVLITQEQTFRRDFVLYRSVTGVALKWSE